MHVVLDKARYHHAEMLKPRLERPECCLKPHFLWFYAPHLNPLGRLWDVVHRYAAHSRIHLDLRRFAEAVYAFCGKTFPGIRERNSKTVTDNFRVITHDKHCIVG